MPAVELAQVASATSSDELAVRVDSVAATGAGCPAGTWTATVSDDGRSVKVDFLGFGDDIFNTRSTSSRDCALTIALEGSDGIEYVPQLLSTEGISQNAEVWYESSVYWSTRPDQRRQLSRGATPPLDSWMRSDSLADIASACSGPRELRIDGTIRGTLPSGSGSGRFGVASANVQFAARRCEVPARPEQANPTPDAGPTSAVGLPSSGLKITEVVARGPGCPAGTSKVELSADGQNFLVSFERYALSGGSLPTDAPLCNLIVTAEVPPDQAVALESFVVAGTAQLPVGAIADIAAAPTFTGSDRDLANTQHLTLRGPYDGAFMFAHRVPEAQLQFSPCGTNRKNYVELHLAYRDSAAEGPHGARFQIDRVGAVKYALRSCVR